jgi:hypothetical protein
MKQAQKCELMAALHSDPDFARDVYRALQRSVIEKIEGKALGQIGVVDTPPEPTEPLSLELAIQDKNGVYWPRYGFLITPEQLRHYSLPLSFKVRCASQPVETERAAA